MTQTTTATATNGNASSWPIVQVEGKEFSDMLQLMKDLKYKSDKKVTDLQPRMCLKCWMIICASDAPKHKGHTQTS